MAVEAKVAAVLEVADLAAVGMEAGKEVEEKAGGERVKTTAAGTAGTTAAGTAVSKEVARVVTTAGAMAVVTEQVGEMAVGRVATRGEGGWWRGGWCRHWRR